eukprot:1173871-Prorocentrum_minimum.AAC.1
MRCQPPSLWMGTEGDEKHSWDFQLEKDGWLSLKLLSVAPATLHVDSSISQGTSRPPGLTHTGLGPW